MGVDSTEFYLPQGLSTAGIAVGMGDGSARILRGNDSSTSTATNTLAQMAPDPKQVKLFISGGPVLSAGLLRGPDGAAMKQAIKDFVNK